MSLDGAAPYQEAASARFRWQWEEATAPERNASGDDTRPQQQRASDTNTTYLTNPDGFVQGPLKIYLEAGEHEIRLDFVSQPAEILSFALTAPEQPLSYEETLSAAVDAGMELVKECVVFEAEDHATAKNSGQIQRAFSDDPLSTPFEIEKGIPDILDQLQGMSDAILEQCGALNAVCGGTSLAENSLRQNAELLLVIARNYQRIQNNITDITSIQTNLSLWEENLRSQPLQIDKFLVGAREDEKDTMASSAWQKAEAMLYNFMLSFYKDYDQVGGRTSGEDAIILDVWASMSIEEADVLKTLCDGSFTAETGVAINLNIMPAGQLDAGAVNALLLAIVSGNAPDIALGVSTGTPVELAIRDAVVDFSALPGYEELIAEFPQNTLRANTFMGGVYGIPERLGFTAMFYRKDILSALGLPCRKPGRRSMRISCLCSTRILW